VPSVEYENLLNKFGEYGVVEEVRLPVALISGLPGAKTGELVVFENNEKGQVISLGEKANEVLILSDNIITAGLKVARTGENFGVWVGNGLLGCTINSLGDVLIPYNKVPKVTEYRGVDVSPLSITKRMAIKDPLLTGVSVVDLLVPLGRGQRELVVGDRKTGKTSFLLSVCRNQVKEGSVVIYAAVGKNISEVKKIRDYLQTYDALKSAIIVFSSSADSPSLIYQAPFTAMTIAEFFRDRGENVLVILDDLSNHAKAYREISLLAKRFPGRESYPGDIFYVHSRLLERGGVYERGSITCLPVGETLENDLTSYIVSNLIGITDGHILFDTEEFLKGRRPAVNILLSITRVGRQTHNVLHQEINSALLSFVAEYQRILDLSHFGAEITDEVKNKLSRGEKLMASLDQPADMVIPFSVQMVFLGLLWIGAFDDLEVTKIAAYRGALAANYEGNRSIRKSINSLVLSPGMEEFLVAVERSKAALLKLCEQLKG